MTVFRTLASACVCLLFLIPTGAAHAGKNIDKLLSDHPGSATQLTVTQKSEIKAFVKKAKGNKGLVCTGLSLTGQSKSMYRVVRLRANLVCSYAKSLDSSLKTTTSEKTTKAANQNGRVVISSR